MPPDPADAQTEAVRRALVELGWGLTQAFASPVAGDPEDQLKSHLRPFVEACAQALGFVPVVAKTESRYVEVGGRPDLGVAVRGALTGHVELKAPGRGANPTRFRAHDRGQWDNFKNLPNLIYTDGLEWALFRTGRRVHRFRLDGDPTTDGAGVATQANAWNVTYLWHAFFSWQPVTPAAPKQLAEALAPLARLLRREVLEALDDPASAIAQLRGDWRSALFADADPPQFADAYAQTLTYALLLARLDGLPTVGAGDAAQDLLRRRGHALLADVLRTLVDPQARQEIDTPVDLLERVIGAVDVTRLRRADADPWLYFYEDFLSAYDPALRRNRGVYYTPVQVVRAQVRLVGQLLSERFGKPLTYADEDVVTLDPAAGTGAYPLAAVEHALAVVEEQLGTGAVPGYASALARNVHAFELLVGAYAVAHLRVSERIQAHGGELPPDGAHVYLSDTLESPHAEPPGHMALSLRALAVEHERARRVKSRARVLVCLGNPPYDRQVIDPDDPATRRKGGWVRHGDRDDANGEQAAENSPRPPLLDDFLEPARQAGAGVHLKNLYNDYVYFWRWALWKVFDSTGGPGVVSFITAASYLRGPGFVGMREMLRRTFDDLWIIDLEGDALGARKTENVFAIRTPVAIAVGVRRGPPAPDQPAQVRYTRLTGTAEQKLARLAEVRRFDDLDWETCFTDWQRPLLPKRRGDYFDWPLLTDLFPWQYSGLQAKRTWPIAPDAASLASRWRALLGAGDRYSAMRAVERNALDRSPPDLLTGQALKPLGEVPAGEKPTAIVPYAYRSFDRQWLLADARVLDRPRPPLWRVYGDRQVFMTSLLTGVLGSGPAATVTSYIPDYHHFRGSYGGKDTIPLWRDAAATEPNVTRGLLEALAQTYGFEVRPDDLFAYAYALLASPAYVERFSDELTIPGPRIPLTQDPALFRRAAALGAELVWLHTYGQRFTAPAASPALPTPSPNETPTAAPAPLSDATTAAAAAPPDAAAAASPPGAERPSPPAAAGAARAPLQGAARCLKPVGETPNAYPERFQYDEPQRTLRVGAGVFAPVDPQVWQFAVSGFQVLRSWLAYRMRAGAGRTSSPLDDIRPTRWTAQFTRELLELLWTLEATCALHPTLEPLLEQITQSPTLPAATLPHPTNNERQPPKPHIASEHPRIC